MGSDNGRNRKMTLELPRVLGRGHPSEARPLPESVWSRSNPSSHRLKSRGGGFGYPQDMGHGQAVPRTTFSCIFSALSNAS